jgi:hypothetical protein
MPQTVAATAAAHASCMEGLEVTAKKTTIKTAGPPTAKAGAIQDPMSRRLRTISAPPRALAVLAKPLRSRGSTNDDNDEERRPELVKGATMDLHLSSLPPPPPRGTVPVAPEAAEPEAIGEKSSGRSIPGARCRLIPPVPEGRRTKQREWWR